MAQTDETIHILKQAVIMEHRGKAMYEQVAGQTPNKEVQKIFRIMADEEQLHIDFLKRQYENYMKSGSFSENDFAQADAGSDISGLIITDSIRKEISGAGFEAAAISAAIDMENKSVEVYSRRASEATDPNEKALYDWLANWEKGHHKLLLELNKQLTEQVWYDNQFWPF